MKSHPAKATSSFQAVDLETSAYAGGGGIGLYPFGDWNGATFPSFRDDINSSGDIFMNTALESGGTFNYGTLLHEIGHAIGLKHPTEAVTDYATWPWTEHDQVLSADDPALTIMATVGGADDHLKQLDKDAAAHLYGAAGTGGVYTGDASGSNSVSKWSWNSATETLTQTGRAGADAIRGSSVTDIINGGSGDDRLFGLAGNDTLSGSNGADFLEGGSGNDTMKGGAGDDSYYVNSFSDKVVEAPDGRL